TKVPEQHAECLGLHRLRVESSNPTVPTIASSSPKFEWTTSPCLLGEIRATAGRAMVLLVPHSYRNALVRGDAFKCGQAILSYQRVESGAGIAASRLRARSSTLADQRVSRRQVVSHAKELGGHHEQANVSARARDCCALSVDGPRAEQRQLR